MDFISSGEQIQTRQPPPRPSVAPQTLAAILEAEPRLRTLIFKAAAAGRTLNRRRRRGRYFVFESFKARMSPLVGWHCSNPELADGDSWDTVYRALAQCLGV